MWQFRWYVNWIGRCVRSWVFYFQILLELSTLFILIYMITMLYAFVLYAQFFRRNGFEMSCPHRRAHTNKWPVSSCTERIEYREQNKWKCRNDGDDSNDERHLFLLFFFFLHFCYAHTCECTPYAVRRATYMNILCGPFFSFFLLFCLCFILFFLFRFIWLKGR